MAGLLFRPDALVRADHTWLARRAGGTLVVGLDDLAQRLMPSVTGVELQARPGTVVRRGEPLATVLAGARSLTIPSPVSGVVRGLNPPCCATRRWSRRDAYGRGWLVSVDPRRHGDCAALPSGEPAEAFLRSESARWNRFVEGRLGYGAADGGDLVAPAPWLLGDKGWRELADAFVDR